MCGQRLGTEKSRVRGVISAPSPAVSTRRIPSGTRALLFLLLLDHRPPRCLRNAAPLPQREDRRGGGWRNILSYINLWPCPPCSECSTAGSLCHCPGGRQACTEQRSVRASSQCRSWCRESGFRGLRSTFGTFLSCYAQHTSEHGLIYCIVLIAESHLSQQIIQGSESMDIFLYLF